MSRPAQPDRARPRYFALLAAQTACAAVVLFNIHAAFGILIANLGTPNTYSAVSAFALLAAAGLGQICYWRRWRSVPVPSCWRSPVLGHLLCFAARLGFIFGSALFSVYFLRHAPKVDLSLAAIAWRGGLLVAIVFALYCYTLELERLGLALQAPPLA
ncbi:hypothetical protein [Bosea sp. (in: a-proteobacteria)]|uniref:hypothetical protein n=1 Tax=Bosea sp. (in: a-proteobacteria) TaxID=1871050 RepID=UPI003B3A07FC